MTTLMRRTNHPILDTLDWLDAVTPFRTGWDETRVDVEEYVADGKYVVRADIPGVDPDKDISVSIDNDVLTIHGERREEKHDKHRSEVRYGEFTRAFRLPTGCTSEDISAKYEHGVLEVSVPMPDQPAEPQKIAIAHGD